MKISILTPTYNRADLLSKLYNSIINNLNYKYDIEWLIMDDGSTDNTKEIIEKMKTENKIEIKYFFQENQGKMIAINNLVQKSTGDIIIDCDSDDYFTNDAFEIIQNNYEKYKNEKDIYGFCFLKYDENKQNMGQLFKNEKTSMFDLYFKEGEDGEKAIVFIANIRKKYKHELEQNEKFITEARMYHKMDRKYNLITCNKPIMICEYQKEGYSKNIIKQFIENPHGYYKYFQEILQNNMKKVNIRKRLYVIKHYILFSYLTKSKNNLKNIKDIENKILYILLYIPGIIKSKMKFKQEK